MNNRYNIGKIIYKVDAFVDRTQDTFITKDITTNTVNINSELRVGQSEDDFKNIILEQKIDEQTLEIQDASLYAPNINIGKSIFLNDKELTDITVDELKENDPNKIIATKEYVDTHSGTIDLSDYKDIVNISNVNNELTAKIIKLNNNELNNVSKVEDNDTPDNKTIPTLLKVQNMINTGGVDLSNYTDKVVISHPENQLTAQKITLNSNEIIDIITKDSDTSDNNKKLITYAKVNEMLDDIDLTNYVSKNDTNDQTLSSNLILNNKGLNTKDITLNNTNIIGVITKDNDTSDDNKKIITYAKVNEMLEDIDLTNYVSKIDTNDQTLSSNIILNNKGLTTKNIIINNNEINAISKVENNDNPDNKTIPTLLKVQNMIETGGIDLSDYSGEVNISNPINQLTAQKITLNHKEAIDISQKTNDSTNDNKTLPTLSKVNELLENYVSKTDTNDQTLQSNIILNNKGLNTKDITINNTNIIGVITKDSDTSDNNKKLITYAKLNDEFNNYVSKIDTNDQTLLSNLILNNKGLTTNNMTLNGKDVIDISIKTNDSTNDNKTLPTLSKVNEIIGDYVSKIDNNKQTIQGPIEIQGKTELLNDNNEIKAFKLYIPINNE